MAQNVSDEALAKELQQAGVVSFDQLEAARAVQAERAQQDKPGGLGEVLVQQGVITQATLDNVTKKARARQAGGIRQLGQYKIVRKLGEGGMGAVFLAEDTHVGRSVALKVLSKKLSEEREFLTRFRREAQATGKLNHVNIVCAYTVSEEQGIHYYAMEHCDGEGLDALLKRVRILPVDKATDVMLQVARGLDHAHRHGIIHRDIKPANIFICRPPTGPGVDPDADPLGLLGEGFVAKILDLGLSKDLGSASSSFYTQTGVAMGTPHYVSPEQAKGDKEIDGRTDIYSLGATYYHLVTGRTPFSGSTAAVVMMKHLSEELPNPKDLNPAIPDGAVHVIQRMMAKEPGDRYANCKELLEDLELVMEEKTPSSAAIGEGKSSVAMARRLVETIAHTEGAPAAAPGGRRRTTGPAKPVPGRRRGERVPPEPSAKRKSYLLWSGVGAVAVMVILLMALSGNGEPTGEGPVTLKKDGGAGGREPPSLPEIPKPASPEKKDPVKPLSSVDRAAPAESVGWIELFDGESLNGWRVVDTVETPTGGQRKTGGNAVVRDGQIVIEPGSPLSGIARTRTFPRINYEVSLEAMRLDGKADFCATVLPVHDMACQIAVGGGYGNSVGLQRIDGKGIWKSGTVKEHPFENRRWYRVRILVTTAKVQVWIDDEKLIDASVPGRQFDLLRDHVGLKPFGFCTWDRTRAALRKIRYRRLGWERLFDGVSGRGLTRVGDTKPAEGTGLEVKDGWLEVHGSYWLQSPPTGKDMAICATVEKLSGAAAHFNLRRQEDKKRYFYFARVTGQDEFAVGKTADGKSSILKSVTAERKHTDAPLKVVFSVVGDELTLAVNGKVVIRLRDPEPLGAGAMVFGTYSAKARFRDVYGVILDAP